MGKASRQKKWRRDTIAAAKKALGREPDERGHVYLHLPGLGLQAATRERAYAIAVPRRRRKR